ncbi:helix-turn-helix domain-containing protein [Winogradskyella forsetii]|uniref:helix-turn-helix domain-containing protein n=1 Tax=Winogradskyella forsetii TaxID=2686077 RepID=UPI0015BFA375|nr:helix-turn-helix domain-containing protein [Winogradskyella forsetii]
MIYNQHLLKAPLKDFIESIFYFKGFTPDHSIERVVPTGHVFILFELDGIERHTYDRETLKPNGTYKNVWVSGTHKDYLSISAPQNSEMLVVQFKTSGAYPFIHQPIHQLNNKVVEAQELFGQAIIDLRTQIAVTKDTAEKFNILENWLTKRFTSTKVPNPSLIHVLNELRTKPIADHNTIISSYSKTQKHLINEFKTYFGLTPKVLHRIFRFNELLKQIQNKEHLAWSQITYEFGYSDQSHFIKEFKEFSGFNPQEFIKSDFHKDDDTNFFPLDRKG